MNLPRDTLGVIRRTAIVQQEPDLLRVGGLRLEGRLCVPESAHGLVVCIGDSGSSLSDAGHRAVANALNEATFATLLIDLLTAGDHEDKCVAARQRHDIPLLASRLLGAIDWLEGEIQINVPVGYFGTGVGAAVALAAAVDRPASVSAIVSLSGRPLLVRPALPQVRAPTLLIAFANDAALIRLNRAALPQMLCEKCLTIVATPRAEPGPLREWEDRALRWFEQYLVCPPDP
jgi:dienelactone hydrolase